MILHRFLLIITIAFISLLFFVAIDLFTDIDIPLNTEWIKGTVGGVPTEQSASDPISTINPPSISTEATIQARDFSSPANTQTLLSTLRELRVAYSIDTGPFSYNIDQNGNVVTDGTGDPSGLEVEMIKEFVRQQLNLVSDNEVNEIIRWIPIHEYERIDAATRTDVDLVIGAISHTKERCTVPERTCTHVFHWKDNAALLVRSDSGISNFCSRELEGQNLAVISNTTTDKSDGPDSDSYARCPTIVPYGLIVPYSTRRQAFESVANEDNTLIDSDNVSAYITDRKMLEFYRKVFGYEGALDVVGKAIQPEEYVFIMKKENDGLRMLLDNAVEEMMTSALWSQWIEQFELEDIAQAISEKPTRVFQE